jgi:hypothetical protein
MEVFMNKPIVFPTSLDLTLVADRVSTATVQVSSIERAATVSAGFQNDVPDLVDARVTGISILRIHTIVLDNPDRLPPGVGPLPPQTEEVLVAVAQSDGSPLRVEAGQFVRVTIATQVKDPAFTSIGAALVISGDTWDPIFVPVLLTNESAVEPAFRSAFAKRGATTLDAGYEL